MEDENVLDRIQRLVEEEHRLENDPSDVGPDRSRIDRINVQLDQCWDLLRRRRARREVGEDPDQAQPRSADTVEHYDPDAPVAPDEEQR
jgi:hypothetical protein